MFESRSWRTAGEHSARVEKSSILVAFPGLTLALSGPSAGFTGFFCCPVRVAPLVAVAILDVVGRRGGK